MGDKEERPEFVCLEFMFEVAFGFRGGGRRGKF